MDFFYIILSIFLLLFGFLAFRSPKLTAYIILSALPTYVIRFEIFALPATLLEAMILILFFTFFFRNRHTMRIGRWWIPCVLLLLASGIALFVTPDLHAGLGILKAYIVEPMLFFVVLTHVFEQKNFGHIFIALGISVCLIASIAVFQYATGFGIPEPWNAELWRRATSVYGYPNAVGLYLAPITALFFAKFVHLRTGRMFALIIICFGMLGIFVSRTEGALIAIIASAFFVITLTKYWRTAIVIFALLLLLGFSVPDIRHLLLFQDVSGDVRLALWKGTWNLLQAHPLQGAGLAGFPFVYDRFRLPSHVELLQYPHNIFLDFWVELGLLGLVWLIGICVWYFFTGLRVLWRHTDSDPYVKIILAPMIATFVYGLVDVTYFKNDLAVLFWLWLAVMRIIAVQKLKNSL